MGIDPGTLFMGYCIIEVAGNDVSVLEMDVLKLSSKKDNYERLQLIHRKVTELAKQYKPVSCAIEAPFFGKNVQSMLKLGRAQGVAIAAAMNLEISVTEYSPKLVKQSITGNGNADKEQVWKMLEKTVELTGKPKYWDATDALAVALCHHYKSGPLQALPKPKATSSSKKKNGDWEKFIQLNNHRVV
jgi:crossover junction endodeoxyribonuclease RuvC